MPADTCLAHDAAVFHMKHLEIRRSRRGLNTLHQWGPDNIVVDIGSMCSHNKPRELWRPSEFQRRRMCPRSATAKSRRSPGWEGPASEPQTVFRSPCRWTAPAVTPPCSSPEASGPTDLRQRHERCIHGACPNRRSGLRNLQCILGDLALIRDVILVAGPGLVETEANHHRYDLDCWTLPLRGHKERQPCRPCPLVLVAAILPTATLPPPQTCLPKRKQRHRKHGQLPLLPHGRGLQTPVQTVEPDGDRE